MRKKKIKKLLQELTSHDDVNKSIKAAQLLSNAGASEEVVFSLFATLIMREQEDLKQACYDSLIKMGDDSIPFLIKLLKKKQPEFQNVAIQLLASTKSNWWENAKGDPDIIDALLFTYKNVDISYDIGGLIIGDNLRDAFIGLKSLIPTDVLDYFIDNRSNNNLWQIAFEKTCDLDNENKEELLLKLLDTTVDSFRSKVIENLSEIGTKKSAKSLCSLP